MRIKIIKYRHKEEFIFNCLINISLKKLQKIINLKLVITEFKFLNKEICLKSDFLKFLDKQNNKEKIIIVKDLKSTFKKEHLEISVMDEGNR